MTRLVLQVLLIYSLPAVRCPAAGRLILVTLDGMGQQIWTGDPAAEELTALRALAAQGVTAEGVIPAFPSTTANSHAAVWTGTYRNGVWSNSNPMEAGGGHTFLERRSGFRAESLRAEPLWVAAGRQGIRTVAHQVTQGFPFLPVNTAPGAKAPPVVINGYQTRRLAPHRVLRAADVRWKDCAEGARLPPDARCFDWTAESVSFDAVILPVEGAIRVSAASGGPAVVVRAAPVEDGFEAGRTLARHFSEALPLGPASGVYFRLFELERGGADFLLFQSAAQELGFHDPSDPAGAERDRLLAEAGPFIPNGPLEAYRNGLLGAQIPEGGDGTAERRYLEVVELITRQYNRYTRWLWSRYSPRLFIDYFPYPDEVDHTWLGLLRLGGAKMDPAAKARLGGMRRWAYRLLNVRLELLTGLAGPDDYVLITSDHGMMAADKLVHAGLALKRAGLDSRAAHLRYCVLLNDRSWAGATVAPGEEGACLDEVERALGEVRDPQTGRPVVTRFFRAPALPAGPGAPALCFDLETGYAAGDAASGPLVTTAAFPFGTHGPAPDREDMRALLIVAGRDLAPGGRWPVLRSIDIAPLAAQLLGIEPPRDAEGRSPLTVGGRSAQQVAEQEVDAVGR